MKESKLMKERESTVKGRIKLACRKNIMILRMKKMKRFYEISALQNERLRRHYNFSQQAV